MKFQQIHRFSDLARRIGIGGAEAWEVHFEAAERKRAGEDIVILTIGQEMLAATFEPIVDAAVESLRSGRHHYSEISGEPELREQIAHHFYRQTGIEVSSSHCAVFAGAQNALFASSLCTLGPGDEVIIIEPYYATYHATFTAGGAKLIPIQTDPRSDFQFELDCIRSKLNDNTKAVVMNSPNNPAGVVYDDWRVRELVEICQSNGLWLISDEVYATLVEPGTFTSPASLPDALDNVITVSSISKSHRMTGWRLGWVVGSEELITNLSNLSLCMAYGLPMFIQDAATYAVSETERYSALVRQDVNANRELVISLLEGLEEIQICGSSVGMFVVFDVRDLGVTDKEFAWHLLDNFNIAALPCEAFGKSGSGLLRINVGESEQNLRRACAMIRECVGDLKSRSLGLQTASAV